MPSIKLDLKTKEDVPYQQLPYINFFQYPPMKTATEEECLSLEGKLALTEKITGEPLFTVFVFIPYCQSRCNSCAYFKSLLPSQGNPDQVLGDYVDCLGAQMRSYTTTIRFSFAQCGAVYIGGGTASLLTSDQVSHVVTDLRKAFNLKLNTEITLEGNPHQLTLEYLRDVKQSGITRVSIGYQSSDNDILRAIGRIHNAVEAVQAVNNAIKIGFETVNLDLLYRVPGQTHEQWKRDLCKAIQLNPSGITTYEYVIHKESNAERLIAKGILPQPVDKDTAHKWYIRARDLLQQNGYLEHRKGSFAKLGHTQQYGALSYDQGHEIIGLGAGAYSFINGYQFQASDDPKVFKKQIHSGLYVVADRLSVQATKRNLMERFVIFSFFSSRLDRSQFRVRFGQDPLAVFSNELNRLKRYGLIKINQREIKLIDLGIKWRNSVFYEFCADEFKMLQ